MTILLASSACPRRLGPVAVVVSPRRAPLVVCLGLKNDRHVTSAVSLSLSTPLPANTPGPSQSAGTSTQSQVTTHYEHHGSWNVGWFLKAVEDIVRRLDGSPASDEFMHTVVGGDAVILVKRIVRRADLEAHHIRANVTRGAGESAWSEDQTNRNALLAMAMAEVAGRRDVAGPASASPEQAEVEHVCKELLGASRAGLVNSGRVGDCCDAVEVGDPPSGGQHPRAFHGFWGVVVQTKDRSGVEGCYLLKAGCSVVEQGCSCTHYTLTRVQEPTGSLGHHGSEMHAEFVPPVADQFVESWRQRRGGFVDV